MFAVIKTGGKQYRVVANQILKVEKVVGDAGDIVQLGSVLMVGEGDGAVVGSPVVADAVVMVEIIEQGRARKVISFKKRRRQNSKRTRGHRQEVTTLRVIEILTGGAKPKTRSTKSANKGKAESEEMGSSSKKKSAKTVEGKSVSQKVTAVISESKED
ncbi:50S ribosomal protein L21 [Bartonella ancashensis]|uniref:Large ribosomal subunit protein bL21 n=1 Tax=Bartonella ancashensis TaxID=1318743 RepID=A0A0M4L5T1_9HYPH|nr:50S ribosomal protein L21 [Bartonella ancashensis]ALE02820.1 LSU ribosomal protein L21p [Bartonella ancashensis]